MNLKVFASLCNFSFLILLDSCLLCDLLESGSAELTVPLNGWKPPLVAARR